MSDPAGPSQSALGRSGTQRQGRCLLVGAAHSDTFDTFHTVQADQRGSATPGPNQVPANDSVSRPGSELGPALSRVLRRQVIDR